MTDIGYCVAVPARNEAARLPILLDALVAQDIAGVVPVALCLNATTDDSVAIIDDYRARHRDRLAIALDVCDLPPPLAHVGTARGRAMDAAAELAGPGGVIVTTDADCRPPSSWLAANLAAIARGVDIVGGRIALDDAEPLSTGLIAIRARLDDYWEQVRGIEDAIDPDPHDPAPRHGDHTGASLAIRVATYRAAGGVPPLPTGEDRALVAAAVAAGGRLAHPVQVWTRTSARSIGRAHGGMAVAMAELEARMACGHEPLVPALDHWRRRADWRAAARAAALDAGEVIRREAALPPMPCDVPLSAVA